MVSGMKIIFSQRKIFFSRICRECIQNISIFSVSVAEIISRKNRQCETCRISSKIFFCYFKLFFFQVSKIFEEISISIKSQIQVDLDMKIKYRNQWNLTQYYEEFQQDAEKFPVKKKKSNFFKFRSG
jgi:hypothetical protein